MEVPPETLERARALRRRMTLPEVLIWQSIRRKRLNGLHFRRQHPVGPYILDFYCEQVGLAVEIDGRTHDEPDRIRHDQRRAAWLRRQGIDILHLEAQAVLADLDEAVGLILRQTEARLSDR